MGAFSLIVVINLLNRKMLNPAELYRKSLIAFGKTVGNCRLCQLSMTRKLTTPGHNDRNNDEFQTERSEEVLTKRLDIAIVGHPNAGKSTLVNSLCGKNIMPVSSKVHTTRAVMHGYVTEDDTQLIFWDTPGLVTSKQARRHKLPKSIYDDPRHAFLQCDVIALMIDCVDHKHTNKIPQVVKEELASLFSTPSMLPDKEVVLLLNKIDLFKGTPKKLKIVVQVLTEGVVGGKSIESISTQSNPGKGLLASDFSSHLTDKFKRQLNIAESFKTESTEESISSDYVTADSISSSQENVSYSKPSLVDVLDRDDAEYFSQLSLLKQRRGFNGFSAVFQLSALQGYGVADLKTYFLQRAKPGRFEVKDGVYTNASLEKVVQNAIISRVFENLPHHLPYKVNIELQNIFETEHELVVVAVLVTPYQMGLVLGQNANTLRRIVAESKELISHIVEVPVKLSLTAEERFYVSRRN